MLRAWGEVSGCGVLRKGHLLLQHWRWWGNLRAGEFLLVLEVLLLGDVSSFVGAMLFLKQHRANLVLFVAASGFIPPLRLIHAKRVDPRLEGRHPGFEQEVARSLV